MLLMCFLIKGGIIAQQLDKIGKEDPLKLSGGVNVNQVYKNPVYSNDNPYAIVMTGNVNASLYGMSIPVSFTWSNYKWTYTQPFNQFSLSPTYKWVTMHLGWSSMSFSPYSLNGHTFFGAGVELRPSDKWEISAMYGRFQKASAGDSLATVAPAYQRRGYGAKVGYAFDKGEVSVNAFYAFDDTEMKQLNMDSLGILPKENLVLGTHLSLRPWRFIVFNSDICVSSLADDRRIGYAGDLGKGYSKTYLATKNELGVNTSVGSVGFGVEYVAPGYQTLGAYYMVNDFINYTLNMATSLAQGRVNVAATTGLRQNNIDNQSDSDQKDVISQINIGFVPSDKVSFNMSYSNFYNYTYIRTVFDDINADTEYELLDTLSFTQINENINLSANWRFRATEKAKHSLNLSTSMQQATQAQSDVPENTDSRFFNGSAGYSLSLLKSLLTAGLTSNYSRNKNAPGVSETIGPVLFVRKQFFDKKMQTSLSVAWNGTYLDGSNTGKVATFRLSTGYQLKKVHQFNLALSYSDRESISRNSNYFTVNFGYAYRFNWPKENNE
ncbi:MAG: hypothetical protein JW717_05075 [Marinilabiliaceae bacterium]|nr:hypothetical protein [Marinilabiliaceae bacterium]